MLAGIKTLDTQNSSLTIDLLEKKTRMIIKETTGWI
jgi:hypothetical protein